MGTDANGVQAHAVPNGSVLALTGVLAFDDFEAQLRIEHLWLGVNAVITCGARRFNLILNQEGVGTTASPREVFAPKRELAKPFQLLRRGG